MKKNILTFIVLFIFSVTEAQNVLNISGENKTDESVQKIITSIDSLLLKRK